MLPGDSEWFWVGCRCFERASMLLGGFGWLCVGLSVFGWFSKVWSGLQWV